MPQFNVVMAKRRAAMMARVRAFFKQREVLEVETPVLGHGASTDCHIDLFTSTYLPSGATHRQNAESVYLQTSPELYMKRLLIAGFPDIFQIGKVFRNGEKGRLHNPEFTMLEWYRHGFDMYRLIDEVTELLQDLCGEMPVTCVTYQDLFVEMTGINPHATSISEIETLFRDGEPTAPEFLDLTDALLFTMAVKVEPKLPPDELVFVYNYPYNQAILSVVDPDDNRVARRFELYYKGMELANGFEELTDPKENRKRLEEEDRRRCLQGKVSVKPDSRFCDELKNGMPQCSGVAVGLDRILLCTTPDATINDVVSFGWDRC